MGLILRISLLATTLLVSCGSGPFGYKSYNLKPNSWEGKLEGEKPEDDLDLSRCKDLPPDPGTPDKPAEQNRCTVMFTPEFYRLKAEVLQLRETVECYQKGQCK